MKGENKEGNKGAALDSMEQILPFCKKHPAKICMTRHVIINYGGGRLYQGTYQGGIR